MASPKTSPQAARSATPGTKGVLVLGMHRSGTSAMTRVLNLLGCALPEDLLGPGDGNSQGHWESQKAVALNDEILASAGSTWEDWGPINADWRASGTRAAMLDRVTAVVEEHAALGPLFVLKDPRLCRLADLWLEGFAQAGVEPLVVLMVRNPENVAASLEQRDLMVPHYAQLLWLRHVLDAEYFSRGTKRVVCRYGAMVADWRMTIANIRSGLGLALPRNAPAVHNQIDAFLDDRLRHHANEATRINDDPDPSDWLGRTQAILYRWSMSGEDVADHADLDAIRADFDRAYSNFAQLLLASATTGQAGAGSELQRELEAKLSEAELAAENTLQLLQGTEQEKAAAIARMAELEEGLSLVQEQANAYSSEIARLEEHARGLSEALDSQQRTAEELAAHGERISADLAKAQELAGQYESLRAREAEDAAELARTVEGLRAAELRIAELTGQLAAAESTLIQRQEELAQLWDRTLAAERATAVALADLATERDSRGAAEEALQLAQAEIEHERTQLAEAELKRQEAVRELAIVNTRLREALQKPPEPPAALLEENARLNQQLRSHELARADAERKVSTRFDEIARITAILQEEGRRVEAADAHALWLSELMIVTERFPAWWSLLPKRWRKIRERDRYRKAGLFDGDAYLRLYPDVAAEGMDPLRHYLMHGQGEGRARPT